MAAGRASAGSFSGALTYTGALGPVATQRPLCVCLYTDAALNHGIGCLILRRNTRYQATGLNGSQYYAIAFLDIHINERLDADEPFEIYHDRGAGPADPIAVAADPTDIDFVFGDENLPVPLTPTATPPPSATATPSLTPSPSPTEGGPTRTPSPPSALAGDCNDNGVVSVDELVRAVGIALESLDLATCPAADLDGNGVVRIEELIAALNVALGGGTS